MRLARDHKVTHRLPVIAQTTVHVATRYGVLVAWVAVVLIYGMFAGGIFLQRANFATIFSTQSVLLILTLAMLPGLAAGEYDLSIAATMGISYVVVGWLNIVQGWAIGPTIMVAVSSALLVGIVNAIVIVVLDVPSLVATLGMGTLLAGLALGINNTIVAGVAQPLVTAARLPILGLEASFYYGLTLTCLLWYITRYTPLGRYIYFVGSGRDVARLAGIRVESIRAGTLIAGSVVAGLDGVLLAGRFGSVDPNFAPGLLLPAFAGAFLGSTTVTPGRFNPWGTFIAVYFLATGINGLELMGITGWVEQVFFGGALIVGVVISRLAARREVA